MWIKFEQELYNSDQFTRIICADWSNERYVITLCLDRYFQSDVTIKFNTAKKRDIAFNNIILALEDGDKPIVDLNDIRGILKGD